ncbi:MAG: molecular chaperone TorD family protein [Ideonella sp.]|nr:molecular chaperone TorD family protein [Ideonella sp.]MCC7459554.1 molecular chaperone TorD family protein [Nitrospira sp.]
MKPPPVLASSRVYGALALVFADPDRAALPALRRCAGALEAAPGDAARTLAALLGRLRLERWRTAHVTCFGYAISKECPPYETEYDQANLFQKTHTLADIAGFYRAFGLQLAPELHERADHLSVELEFMQFLCLKEAHAAARGEAPAAASGEPRERVAQCRAAQAKFFAEHLGVWASGFARRLRAVAGSGLYAAAASALEAFLAAEADRLGVAVGTGGRLNEAPEEAEPACAAPCGAPVARIEVMHART